VAALKEGQLEANATAGAALVPAPGSPTFSSPQKEKPPPPKFVMGLLRAAVGKTLLGKTGN